MRAKDIPDRLFLRQMRVSQGIHVELPSPSPPPSNAPLSRGFRRRAAWWRK